MHEHILRGCQPEPLSSYLEGLAVLRLVAEQADAGAAGHWRPQGFTLTTALSRDALRAFFLDAYRPSAVLNPWNGDGGFFDQSPKSASAIIEAIEGAAAERLAIPRQAVKIARDVLRELGIEEPARDEAKAALANRLRDRLPDEAVRWLDAVLVVGDTLGFPPVLGTGGSDGRFEMAKNYWERMSEVVDFETGQPTPDSGALLDAALFDVPTKGLSKSSVGQFDPYAVGGNNAGPGFSGKAVVNPWDFVLLMEGTLMLTSATARKLENAGPGALTYPFSVRAVGADYASAAPADEESTRHELWLPLWDRPTSAVEVARLFAEGRADIGRKRAVHAIDFARAIGTLGVDRGIAAFTRYGFHQRNGKAYFAMPLGRWEVRRNPRLELVEGDVARWVDKLRSVARGKNAPASVVRAASRVERAMFDLAKGGDARVVQAMMLALAEAEATLTRSPTGRESIWPVPALSWRWLREADDGSREHQLAVSLASTDIRERLTFARWRGRYVPWMDHEDHRTVWGDAPLLLGLAAVADRRDIESTKVANSGATTSASGARPAGIPPLSHALRAFLDGAVDDERLAELTRAYSLVPPWQVHQPRKAVRGSVAGFLPPAYALCALAYHRIDPQDADQTLPRTPGIVTALRAGQGSRAAAIAARRLQGAGAPASVGAVPMTPDEARRVAAALAFPLGGELARIAARSALVPGEDPAAGDEELDGADAAVA